MEQLVKAPESDFAHSVVRHDRTRDLLHLVPAHIQSIRRLVRVVPTHL
jgi:hypothetical protein